MLKTHEAIQYTIIQEIRFLHAQADIGDEDEAVLTIGLETHLTDDLAFSSLMLARLVMMLNSQLQAQPFAQQYRFSDIRTVKHLVDAYHNVIQQSSKEAL